MTSVTARRVAWSAVGVGSALVIVGAVVLGWAGDPPPDAPFFRSPPSVAGVLVGLVLVGLFGGAGALIVTRFPSNLLGWTLIAGALTISMLLFGTSYGYAGHVVRPGELPGVRVVLVLLGDVLWLPFVSIQIVGLLVLFPDGRLASSGRRRIFLLGLAGAVIGSPGFAVAPNVYGIKLPNPLAVGPRIVSDTLATVGSLMVLGAGIAAVASLIGRFRRSRGDERQQMKWFVYASALMLVGLIPVNVVEEAPAWLQVLAGITTALLPVAVGVAILRYRLYDIDVVINKTLVYGILAGFVTLVFLALVVGVGTLAGGTSNTFLAAVAAAVVAIVFQPVRRWAQHLANRLVYGERATPYEVLSGFSERLAETYSIDDVLPRIARVLAEGIGAARVAVILRQGDRRAVVAEHPMGGPTAPATSTYEVKHQGTLLGEIEIVMPPGESLDPAREKLVRDVAAQAGLVLRNAALIEDLRESRRRIVAAQDARAKKLERDIHDGAQQQLVALAVKERLAASLVGRNDEALASLLEQLQTETGDALENLRDLARGIYPPLLADRGLLEALESQSRKSPVPVTIEASGIARYPAETEAAVYFSVLESLQNVAKYADASRATVRMAQSNGTLSFEVEDDGVGFDLEAVERGSGLQGIADRVAALGGEVTVTSAPGDGTTVAGHLPVEVTP